MYSFLSSDQSITIKNHIHEQVFSLLGNAGKTLFFQGNPLYAEVHTSWYNSVKNIAKAIWLSPTKRFLAYLGIALASVTIAPPGTSFAANETSNFIVTAYYSPLPNQSFYLRGNYAAEVRLNGNGTHGASGAPVFTGMIAAPKSYDFGTQIFFDGLGLGTVSDRGGAIVDAGVRGQEYDRIDIWMGYGESGLRRAMAWGRRVVTGTTVSTDIAKNMNPVDLAGIDNGRVDLSSFPSANGSSANSGLSSSVLSAFEDLGYTPINGSVAAMVLQYQLDHNIVTSENDVGAGNYGPKTRASLQSVYTEYKTLRDAELKEIEKARQEMLDEHTAWQERYEKAQNSVTKFGTVKFGQTNASVLALQSLLAEEGFFTGKINGQMRGDTLLAIRRYQRAHDLTLSGKIDPQTQARLIIDLLDA